MRIAEGYVDDLINRSSSIRPMMSNSRAVAVTIQSTSLPDTWFYVVKVIPFTQGTGYRPPFEIVVFMDGESQSAQKNVTTCDPESS